jgi:diguanylate cyclase (GGDEF)-like protein/PAS domain S-box-containing protein
MTREKALLQKIEELEKSLSRCSRAELAIDAADFDVWENNFVTGDTFGTNRRSFESVGYSEAELPKTLGETFQYIHPDDLADALKKVNAHFEGETPRYQAEMRLRAKDGSWVWFGNYGQVMERNEEGQVTRFIGLTFNIDQRRMLEEEIKTIAYSDSLTGLGNRRGFYEMGKAEIARCLRYDRPLSVVMFDIDRFKAINDDFGHLAGDEVLKGIGDCVKATVRDSDLKARWGGDEFILMLPETDAHHAKELAERLLKTLEGYAFYNGIPVTISVGISVLNVEDDMETLVKRADQALYLAKHKGRNRIEF